MDYSLFGLTRRPFRPTPDTDSYFPSATHEAALAAIRDAFDNGDEGTILTGDVGAGKTVLAHRFLDWLTDETKRMLLPSAKYVTAADLHRAILFDLGQPWQGRCEQELRLAVTEHFLNELAADRRTAMVIDEAHHLSGDAIEELRMLANIAKSGSRATFVLLAGLPTLRDRLDTPWLAAAAQRYRTRTIVEPLAESDASKFIWHQLESCGARDPERIIGEEAAGVLADLSHGIPRLINHLASTSLALAAMAESTVVDVEAVLEAGDRLGLQPDGAEETVSLSQPSFPESPEESMPETLPILQPTRESAAGRTPKQRAARRRSA